EYTGVELGDVESAYSDPMIAKLIVHAVDRHAALAGLRAAQADCHVAGLKTNIGFLEALARHPAVVEGRIDTGYLDRHLDEFLHGTSAAEGTALATAAVAVLLHDAGNEAKRADPVGRHSPWAIADGWRLHGRAPRRLALRHGDTTHEVLATGHGGDWRLQVDGHDYHASRARLHGARLELLLDGTGRRARVRFDGQLLELHDGQRRIPLQRLGSERAGAGEEAGDGQVRAPMPGRVVVVRVAPGQAVAAGDELLVMEAMKMELSVK